MMPTQPQQTDNLNRAAFIKSLGLSGAALMAFYCMGTLSACSSKSTDPAPSTGTGTGTGSSVGLTGNADANAGAINFSLDLSSANYAKLKTVGEYVVVGSVLVANAKGGKFIAVSKACTHQGTTVQYRLTQDDVYCNNHGSQFNGDGTVKQGVEPGQKGLTAYKASLSADGTKLAVTA